MKPASAKAKGRSLQKWVVQAILKVFPGLSPRDVKSTSMGAGGADVLLSEQAFRLFPYSIECKNQVKMQPVFDAYEQAKSHGAGEPLVFVKINRGRPLVIVDAEYFIDLVGNFVSRLGWEPNNG